MWDQHVSFREKIEYFSDLGFKIILQELKGKKIIGEPGSS